MTAQLLTFETQNEYKQDVLISLHYDKHDLFCVTVTIGDCETNLPSFSNKNNPALLPALAAYKRQVKKHTTLGIARTETISCLYDDCYKNAKLTASTK